MRTILGTEAVLLETPAFVAIRGQAAALALPTSYQRDLHVHDRAVLAGLVPGRPFAWVLRESGTNLVLPLTEKEDLEQRASVRERKASEWAFSPTPFSFLPELDRTFSGPKRWFYWNGRTLRPTTPAEVQMRFTEGGFVSIRVS